MRKPAHDPVDRPTFPELEDRIGEDPARFLYTDGFGENDRQLILARIRGIDFIESVNAWIAVERRLTGGRSAIIDALEERKAYLEEHGERDPEELSRMSRRAQTETETQEDESDPEWRHEKCGSTDVEQESSIAWFCHECEQRTNRVEQIDEEGREEAVPA